MVLDRFGGLNTRLPATHVPPGEASAMQNVRTVTGRELVKRRGSTALNATAMSNTWLAKADMPTPRKRLSGFVNGLFLWAVGGANTADTRLDTNERYSMILNTWATKAVMTVAKDYAFNSEGQDLGFVIGGSTGSAVTTNYAYNVTADSWATKAALSSAQQKGGSGMKLTDIHVAVSAFHASYAILANAWTNRTVMTTSVGSAESGEALGLGYVVAAQTQQYTRATDAWAAKTAPTATKTLGGSFTVVNRFVIFGGEGTPQLDTVYRYNTVTNAWDTMSVYITISESPVGLSNGLNGYGVGGAVVSTSSEICYQFNPGTINSIYQFQKSDGSRYIVAGTAFQLAYWTGSTMSSLGTSFIGGTVYPWNFATYNDVLYAVNGNDTMQKWNGTDTATVAVQGNVYQTRTAMTTARSGVAGFALNKRGFICGGTTGTVSAVNERYDEKNNTWTTRTAMATARQLLAGFIHSLAGYVAGGTTGTVSSVVEAHSDETNTWLTAGSISAARSGCAAAETTNYAYVSGGTTGTVSAVHDQLDPTTNTFAAKAAMTTARQDLAAVTVIAVHVFGGSTGTDSAVNERYSEAGNSWTTRTVMTTARDLLGALLATEGITEDAFSIGGHVAGVSAITNRYRYATDTWLARAALGTARSSLAGFTLGLQGYACGGTTGSVSAVVEKYFAGATPPNFRFLTVHKGYGLGAGDRLNPSRMYWSSLGDLSNWPAVNFEDIASDDGDEIVGQFVSQGNFIVCKKDRFYMLPFSDDPANLQIVSLQKGIGLTAPASIVEASDGRVYFCSERGFYAYDGEFSLISHPITPTFFALNQDLMPWVVGVDNVTFGEVWFGVTSGTGNCNDTILAYSYLLSTPERPVWFRYTGITATALASVESLNTDQPVVYHGDGHGALFYHNDTVDNDDGTAITSDWTSGWMPVHPNGIDAVLLRRLVQDIEATASAAGSLTTDLYQNMETTAFQSPTATLAATDRVSQDLAAGEPTWTVQVKFSHSTAAQGWQLNRCAIGLAPLNEERNE